MRRFLLAVLLLAGCHVTPPQDGCRPPWDYQNQNPPAWPPACFAGAFSPVNITSTTPVNEPLLSIEYKAFAPRIYNNERGVKFYTRNSGEGGTITVKRAGRTDTYTLYEFHFHIEGEHTFDGRPAPMELHLVHKDRAGNQKLVVAVLFDDQRPILNPGLAEIIPLLPSTACRDILPREKVDPAKLLPDLSSNKRYYKYQGSLTTPDCDPGFEWFVYDSRATATSTQIGAIGRFIAPNRKTSVRDLPDIELVTPP